MERASGKRAGERPHTARDGRQIVLVEWTSDCVIWGVPIVITAAPHARTVANAITSGGPLASGIG
jgi:hypothetical protein